MTRNPRKRVAILISGRGSNMAALIEAARDESYPAEIVGVISDRADAAGLDIAKRAGIATRTVSRIDYPDKQAQETATGKALTDLGTEIVCLAGYMRLLSAEFVAQWEGRMINIHPSLLPLFKGLDSHRRALEAGMRIHGCTVHFVTAETDGGPIIAQAAVPIAVGDDETSLAARVLKAEHKLYPLALRLVCEGKVRMEGRKAVFSAFPEDISPEAKLISPRPDTGPVDLESLARFTP
ncbi:phosphoribosylglycinamide formyltransferase-1/phosphoribosylamine--glycine ligase/phosphoribosylglycinamide formyltransferase/phosphoribosylformylglycinamidine cyclo-ligase [Mesorhizobium sp. J18]|uniref:phosphoribosylglycinamide formyltransferase n=1 Tax=Mesorhizobium sp. J18 TaxID=935263 RepID=UPI00119BF087|nr:phosphoribosylglycinamide formyltransferase [Mesorhizobium sp. J18]TWG93774.1 phosphoribosylglycinamide formyltransferase-1/phosphoribosylamine--glycine ligase/phosphoribosylglycinamide formyltransferase/phosphoribosylformylglycinamidine cyclo-ligase [Mesorhizobium sp. J18]